MNVMKILIPVLCSLECTHDVVVTVLVVVVVVVVVIVVVACGQDGEHSLVGLAYFFGIVLFVFFVQQTKKVRSHRSALQLKTEKEPLAGTFSVTLASEDSRNGRGKRMRGQVVPHPALDGSMLVATSCLCGQPFAGSYNLSGSVSMSGQFFCCSCFWSKASAIRIQCRWRLRTLWVAAALCRYQLQFQHFPRIVLT